MKKWHKKLEEHIRALGMTNTEAAAALGVGRSAFGHWLKGRRTPRAGKLKEIAAFMGISVSELIEDDPDFARDKVEKAWLELFRRYPTGAKPQAFAMARAFLQSFTAECPPDLLPPGHPLALPPPDSDEDDK